MTATRTALLAKIHIAKKDLGLDEGAYRAMLQTVMGKASCAKANAVELGRVLDHLKGLGWRPKPAARAKAKRLASSPQAKKIRALWLELAAAGVVRSRDEKAIRAYVKRMTGVAALEWLGVGQASRVIEALKKWCRRVGVEVDR